jgi:hypothetical protein
MGTSNSKSQANNSTTNNYQDRRLVNESGLVAVEGGRIDNTSNYTSNVNVQSVDKDIAKAAFDFASGADATNGAGFSKLLDVADKFMTKTTDTASSMAARYQGDVLDAYSRAKADEAGGIDQKTMIVLGVAAAAVVVMVNQRGK